MYMSHLRSHHIYSCFELARCCMTLHSPHNTEPATGTVTWLRLNFELDTFLHFSSRNDVGKHSGSVAVLYCLHP